MATIYEVNEIFYSLKGEGLHTGVPMAFIRLHGCNLKCKFCDTKDELTLKAEASALVRRIKKYPTNHVVITGGEPLTQDLTELLLALQKDYIIHLETNGTLPCPTSRIDWIAVSPKTKELDRITLMAANEVKFLVDLTIDWEELVNYTLANYTIGLAHLWLMPVAKSYREGDRTSDDFIQENIQAAIHYCKRRPRFRFCYQLHKALGIK